MRECRRQGARFRGMAAGLSESCALFTSANDILRQTPTLPAANYAAIEAPGGKAAAAELSGSLFILAIAGPFLSGPQVRRMHRLQGR